jgi:hypothetical protein
VKEVIQKIRECFRRRGNQLMLKIVKDDLKLKLNKKQKVYGLIEAQKAARIQKCRQFLA